MVNKKLQADQIKKIFLSELEKINVREDVASHLVKGIIQASLRGIDSHGIRLFPHYYKGFEKGRLNKYPKYKYEATGQSTGLLDADDAPGHAAGIEGMKRAIELAKNSGVGAVSVSNSSHFGAAAYFSFEAAKKDMIGLSFTHATAHVTPPNGVKPFFGNNPFCLVAPCDDEDSFCFDMATTIATFNKVQSFKDKNEKIPDGWGLDKNGVMTTNPENVLSLLPIGDYKGFGLSMSLEILCSLLSGMSFGPNVSSMFGNSMSEKRKLGHFFIAINISKFVDINIFKSRLKKMMNQLRDQPSKIQGKNIIAPGDPEKLAFLERKKSGLNIDADLIELIDRYQK